MIQKPGEDEGALSLIAVIIIMAIMAWGIAVMFVTGNCRGQSDMDNLIKRDTPERVEEGGE
jgi:hypothetical protein